MSIGDYYVCYKLDERDNKIMYVNEDNTFTYSLESSLKFETKAEVLEAIRLSKGNYEDDEFSYMHSGYDIYKGCSIGKVEVTMHEINIR